MNRPFRSLALAPALVAVLIAGTAGASGAGNPPAPSQPVSEDLHPDAEAYAQDFAVSLEEASQRLHAQNASGPIRTEIANVAPDRLVGVRLEHGDELKIVARFTGSEPIDLPSSISASDIPVEVVTGYRHTAEEVNRAITAIIPELVGIDGIYYDEVADVIALDVSQNDLATSALSPVTAVAEKLDIPVRIDRHDSSTAESSRGGLFLSDGCTSGFTVRNPSNARGFITAAHCDNVQSYRLYTGSSFYATTFRYAAYTGYQDVQWHSLTGHTVSNLFYGQSTVAATRAYSYVLRGNQAGDYVCRRGKTTGYSCGNVNSVSYSPGNICGGPCGATWVRVAGPSLRCYDGDSGGPVFSGTAAYGITKGDASNGTGTANCDFAFHMPIEYALSIGISLLTS